jgi:hypothetical protein
MDHHQHPGSLSVADLEKSASPQTLEALRQMTAPYHDLDAALGAGYRLFRRPPATAEDGCISDMNGGGMGYHYTRGNNLADDSIALLDPEFIVYAPREGSSQDGVASTRLAALEYFLPFSARWPARYDPGAGAIAPRDGFQRAPTLHDFSTTIGLPDVAFVPSTRFGGWMLHIWLWENNPAGDFANWNRSVPLCRGPVGA